MRRRPGSLPLTAGDLPDADAAVRAGERHQVVAQKLGQPLNRQPDGLGDVGGGRLLDGRIGVEGRLFQRVVGDRERQVARQLSDGVVDADSGRDAAVGHLGQVPPAERVEGRADLRQAAEVALGRLGFRRSSRAPPGRSGLAG